jgi:hypothetical protein
MHPNGKIYIRAALIIRSNIKHYEIDKCQEEYLYTIVIENWNESITVSAVYLLPKHFIKNK